MTSWKVINEMAEILWYITCILGNPNFPECTSLFDKSPAKLPYVRLAAFFSLFVGFLARG